MFLFSFLSFVIRVGGVGGFAPLGPEGSAFGTSSHLHESCRGAGLGEGPFGAGHLALPPTHTHYVWSRLYGYGSNYKE